MTHKASLHIKRDEIIGEVHDYLYGANLEHIGQTIYGGIWAEMLRDRKFAGNDKMYTTISEGLNTVNPNIGVIVPWEAVNHDYENINFVHDNTTYYTGVQSQRISIHQADGQEHGIQQNGLYLQEKQDYEVRLVLKGEGQTVTVQLGDVTWTIETVSDEWTSYEMVLSPQSTIPDGALSITTTVVGNLWIGCASLMPSNHMKGYRPDVIEALRDWKPTFLRWPGGNFVSAYDWQLGIGDRDKRPTYLDPAWHQWESNDMGTDEFIDLCELVGCDALLTINMGTGTVEEAAAWVEYCNGSVDTYFGAIRAANGHPEPYNLKTWFVGNEQFGNWQVGHVDAETYARRYLEFSSAMRAVDDDLELIAVGVPTDLYGHWNREVIKIAESEIDQLSVHYYSIRTEKWDTPPSPEHLYLPKIAASHEVAHMLDETIRIADQFSEQKLDIAFDEWNTYVGAKSPDFIEDYNLADALYAGALMNACINRCDRIKMSAIFNLINAMGSYLAYPLYDWQAINLGRGGGWVATSVNPAEPRTVKMPSTLVLELMTRYRGKVAIRCDVDSPVMASPSAGNLPAYDDLPIIDASITYDEDVQQYFLSIVNRGDAPVSIELTGLDNHTEAINYQVTADSPLATNDFSQAEQKITWKFRVCCSPPLHKTLVL